MLCRHIMLRRDFGMPGPVALLACSLGFARPYHLTVVQVLGKNGNAIPAPLKSFLAAGNPILPAQGE